MDCQKQTGPETIDQVLESGSVLFIVHKVSGDSKNVLEMDCIELCEWRSVNITPQSSSRGKFCAVFVLYTHSRRYSGDL